MAGFYSSIIRPLLLEFSELLLRKLDTSPEGGLSKTERVRFLRALHRFQVWCNLFGIGNDARSESCKVCRIEMLRFFGILSPWEMEEISCV